jgi:hypothetical protein
MIDIDELAGRISAAKSPQRDLDALVECVMSGRVVWGGNPEITIPTGEPDFWLLTKEQEDKFFKWTADRIASDLPLLQTELDVFMRFGSRATSDEASHFHSKADRFVRRLKNPNRLVAPRYMSSMDAAMTLLLPGQDFHRYAAYSGQVVMKIVGPSCDYPCIGTGCTPAAGLVVARLRQLEAERLSQPE